MSLLNWIFDIYQHHKLDQTRSEAQQLRQELTQMRGGSAPAPGLERAIGELALAVKTVQRMLVEKGVCSEAEFQARLRQVDLEDGMADGQAPIG